MTTSNKSLPLHDEQTSSHPTERTIQIISLLLVLAAALMFAFSMNNLSLSKFTIAQESHSCLVIDPGHGGIDGGAIALDGTNESEINLAIAMKLRDLAFFCGQPTVLTREDDSRRTDYISYSEHEDLVHRTQVINGVPNGVLISIHQNKYPTSQPSGAQVLYGKGEESRAFGELTHRNILTYLQRENRRVAEPAPRNLYITANVTCPAILVECGFLSNQFDLDQLLEAHYQTAFAAVLLSSFLQFISVENTLYT